MESTSSSKPPRRPTCLPLAPAASLTLNSPDLRKMTITTPELDNLAQDMSLGSRDYNLPVLDHENFDSIQDPVELKRLKNRIAANKCRKKKDQTIQSLTEYKKTQLRDRQELLTKYSALHSQVARLRTELASHKDAGCEIDIPVSTCVLNNQNGLSVSMNMNDR